MRPFALLLLLCACSTLSTEDRDKLAIYQRNAQLFFDGQKWNQAMIQIERGLELDPEDYKLNSLKGGILLLASGDAHGTDHKELDAATELLATLFDTRSLSRHEPILLLNYALAVQKQGLRHLGEALRLEDQATREGVPGAAADLREQARTERARSDEQLRQADELLGELVERGEILRVALNHRLQIALQRGDGKAFEEHAEAYFEQARKAQDVTKKRIEDTKNVDYEREQLAVLRQLVAEEIDVRALAAEYFYSRRVYQKALEHLNRVLEGDPRRFADYYNRGRVLLELGKRDEAQADFRRFLADPALAATSEKALFAMKAISQ